MLRGISTISLWAEDLDAAGAWYTELLGTAPYFSKPGYVEFRTGDYQHELGIIDRRYAPAGHEPGAGGTVVYWHVDDLEEALQRLRSMGAEEREAPVDRGAGFVTASVVDPFGNVLGIMYNPHYLEILRTARPASP